MGKMTLDFQSYTQKARQAVAEGQVLLENRNQVLPFKKGTTVAVFGRMQLHYYKSGTGSGGMVNVNKVTGILEALQQSEDVQVYEPLVAQYRKWEESHPLDEGVGWGSEPWSQEEMALSEALLQDAAAHTQDALVIIGRTAGEDKDNQNLPGSYRLAELEEKMLEQVRRNFARMVVVLNVGNIMDMSFIDKYQPDAVLYAWQGGMIGGLGTADVLTGKTLPSGKLTDTIAYQIADYPSDPHFGGLEQNIYAEDIYVGYRYFETVAPEKVRYPFGYGQSYTTFSMEGSRCFYKNQELHVNVSVENTGAYAGKEVVQIYVGAPQGRLGKPVRVLADFEKTRELLPGEVQEMEFVIPGRNFASYDEAEGKSGFLLEAGEYQVFVGNDSHCSQTSGSFFLEKEECLEACDSALKPVTSFKRMKPVEKGNQYVMTMEEVPLRKKLPGEKRMESLPTEYEITGDCGIRLHDVKENKATMESFIAQLSKEALATIIRGEGMGSPKVTPGTAAAFGGVSKELQKFGIPCGCCSDGPSGMRLDSGMKAFSLPNGTLLACTFNKELVEELYYHTGMEMVKNHVDILLGPGMNIHRHPLNGRNFEYFSEDPLVTGKMAAAQIRGMHRAGVTGAVKHFCANNQEIGRFTTNSIVSERALREIYLRGYEIAVREAQADAIMTTYGAVNGVWTAGNYDLVTEVLHKQWGFKGIVMTDWWAQMNEEGEAPSRTDYASMIRAQNDLYMVCLDAEAENQDDNTLSSLAQGKLTLGELQRSAANICRFLLNTQAYARLEGTETELEVTGAEEGFEEEVKELTYYKVEKEISIDLSEKKVKKGTSIDFALDLLNIGEYRVEITAKSELSELAQLPVTVSIQGTPRGVYTFNGTGNQWVTQSKSMVLDMKYPVTKIYIGQNGLQLKNIKFILVNTL